MTPYETAHDGLIDLQIVLCDLLIHLGIKRPISRVFLRGEVQRAEVLAQQVYAALSGLTNKPDQVGAFADQVATAPAEEIPF